MAGAEISHYSTTMQSCFQTTQKKQFALSTENYSSSCVYVIETSSGVDITLSRSWEQSRFKRNQFVNSVLLTTKLRTMQYSFVSSCECRVLNSSCLFWLACTHANVDFKSLIFIKWGLVSVYGFWRFIWNCFKGIMLFFEICH